MEASKPPAPPPSSMAPTFKAMHAHVTVIKDMLEAQDFAGAALEGGRALESLPVMSKVATMRGHALLTPLINQAMDDSNTYRFSRNDFKDAYEAFRLAIVMDPSNVEAMKELEQLNALLEHLASNEGNEVSEIEEVDVSGHNHSHSHTNAGCDHTDCDHTECDHAKPDAGGGLLDVIVIGAGAAGIGTAHTLTNIFGLDASRVLLVDRGDAIGATFRMWPQEMRFISPSFNQQGWTKSFDLNSVAYGTSPAFSLHTQHPSGEQYADYLTELAEAARLSVRLRTEVLEVVPVEGGGGFDVHVRTKGGGDGEEEPTTTETTLRARYVVWAAGEFQYPRERSDCESGSCTMLGMDLCLHNSRVRSWASLPGDDFVLIGGYESGADAAVNLARAGKQATVLASTATWNVQTADPSTELAPYTGERLRQVTAATFSPRPRLLAPLRVERVERAEGGGYKVVAKWKAAQAQELTQLRPPVVGADSDAAPWWKSCAEGEDLVVHTANPPVLCTGFEGSVAASAKHLFVLAGEDAKGCLAGAPLLTKDDESTKVPGIFLVGPTVRHGELSFCFIYKFRQRFGIVANAICKGLGRDTEKAVEACRKMNMYLDDLECCADTCGSC